MYGYLIKMIGVYIICMSVIWVIFILGYLGFNVCCEFVFEKTGFNFEIIEYMEEKTKYARSRIYIYLTTIFCS